MNKPMFHKTAAVTPRSSERGVTLILVLAILTILTLLGISFTFVMRTEMQAARNFFSASKAEYKAKAMLNQMKNQLAASRVDTQGHLKSFSIATVTNSSKVSSLNAMDDSESKLRDEESKLNLRVALDSSMTKNSQDNQLSFDAFLLSMSSTLNLNSNQTRTLYQRMYAGYTTGQIKSIDSLKTILGYNMAQQISDDITLDSFEANLDMLGNQRLNINQSSTIRIFDHLKLMLRKEAAAQLAVNIVDYRDTDSRPSLLTVDGTTYRGIERTPYLNEAMPQPDIPNDKGLDGQYVELYNPYDEDIPIDGWRLDGSFGSISLYGTIPAQGYLIITNEYADDADYDGGEVDGYSFQSLYGDIPSSRLIEDDLLALSKKNEQLKLFNEDADLIDTMTYTYSNRNESWEKNDPRVDRVYPKSSGSPCHVNAAYHPPSMDQDDLYRQQDSQYLYRGDLAFINYSMASAPWRSLSDTSTLGIVMDLLSLSTCSEIPGIININTAPFEVLMALPGMNGKLASNIIAYRNDNGAFDNLYDLLDVSGMKTPVNENASELKSATQKQRELYNFRRLSNWVSVRSYNFTLTAHARLIENKKLIAESQIKALVNRSKPGIRTLWEKKIVP